MERSSKRLVSVVKSFFRVEAARAAHSLMAYARSRTKAGDDELRKLLDRLLAGWTDLVPDFQAELLAVFASGSESAALLTTDAQLDAVHDLALDFAQQRAAELVGRRLVSGRLVSNPNARWAITEGTRDTLRGLVERAIADGLGPRELAELIEQSVVFSDYRAEMIARTEVAKANVAGHIGAARISGEVFAKEWLLGSEHDHDDECDDNADDGVLSLDDSFSSGDDGPPAHPNCVCALVFYTADDAEAEPFLPPEEEE